MDLCDSTQLNRECIFYQLSVNIWVIGQARCTPLNDVVWRYNEQRSRYLVGKTYKALATTKTLVGVPSNNLRPSC